MRSTFSWVIWVSLMATGFSSASPPEKLIVHEWGTFTSIYGSDGTMLPGVHLDEESLPGFVYSHDIASGAVQPDLAQLSQMNQGPQFFLGRKGFLRPVLNVTVKMETPVLYFYSPETLSAKVKVGFKGGSISQWYPSRSGGEKMPPRMVKNGEGKLAVNPIDFGKSYNGAIEWDITLEPRTADTDFDVMKDGEFPNWIHPRAPKSNVLRTSNGEKETYLFYRGLGNFEQPINYRIEHDELKVEAAEGIPFLLVVDIKGDCYGNILWSGNPGKEESISLKGGEDSFLKQQVYEKLKPALVRAGLYEEEASAMLRTWWFSYFGKPGLRAFWIVPRSFTDEILPIRIEPNPTEVERVLLGRSELLSPEFETRIKMEFSKEDQGENRLKYDRYFPAYRARFDQLSQAEVVLKD